MCEQYQLSDRAATAIANSVLVNVGIITEDEKTCLIDRSKLRRERGKCHQEIQKEEQQNFRLVNAIYFDGRKDATQTEDGKTCVIDRSKLRREREKCHQEIQKEKQQNFRLVNAIYFDGRKDATQMVVQGPNDKRYRSVQLEEHYTAIGEPGSYYLTHVSPEDGKGRTIAQNLLGSIRSTELEDRLAIVGTDGTACMTGKYNGCI